MRFILILFIPCFFAIASCRKDEVIPEEEPWYISYIRQDYVGAWTLSGEAYHSSYYDSILFFKEPQLFLTFTDSIIDYYDPTFGPYYYGVFYENDATVEFMYTHLKIRLLSDPANIISLKRPSVKSLQNCFEMRDPNSEKTFTDEFLWIKNNDEPFLQDSITYKIEFDRPPPEIGLLVRYIDNNGLYTIDTLKSGNWQWEKKVFQTGDQKKYSLEIIGATDAFYENLETDYHTIYALIIPSESYPSQFSDNSIVITTVGAIFNRELGTVDFNGQHDGEKQIRMTFENVD